MEAVTRNRTRAIVCDHRLPVLALALLVCACGPDAGGGLALKIFQPSPGVGGGLRAEVPPAGEAPADITAYRICISADDMPRAICRDFDRELHPHGARVDGLPIGQERRVSFQGYDEAAGYAVRWCGRVSGVPIAEGRPTPVSMYISACGGFTPVREPMAYPRVMHTATVLPDGRVLIAGGFHGLGVPSSCGVGTCLPLTATAALEIYDPATGAFAPVPDLALQQARGMHTASLLADGRVLVAGGARHALLRAWNDDVPAPLLEVDAVLEQSGDSRAGRTAELVDLAAGTVEEIPLGPESARALHGAIRLWNGDVVLMGGIRPADNQPLDTMERFAVKTEGFEALSATLRVPRQGLAVLPFESGTLLWGGNRPDGSLPGVFAEIVEQSGTGAVALKVPLFVGESADLGAPSLYSAGALLADGRAIVCGGMITSAFFEPGLTAARALDDAWLLDLRPGSERLEPAGMDRPRALHTTSPLVRPDGSAELLVAGGLSERVESISGGYDIALRPEFFTLDGGFDARQVDGEYLTLCERRAGHTASVLQDGTLLLAGGFSLQSGCFVLNVSAELYNPAPRILQPQ
ncbi:MAG: hypothetical protein JXR96_10510 [Deltaproteobacteria bacterium]|nr:hypothetical protein [Deltaproteobacteria bacterium]